MEFDDFLDSFETPNPFHWLFWWPTSVYRGKALPTLERRVWEEDNNERVGVSESEGDEMHVGVHVEHLLDSSELDEQTPIQIILDTEPSERTNASALTLESEPTEDSLQPENASEEHFVEASEEPFMSEHESEEDFVEATADSSCANNYSGNESTGEELSNEKGYETDYEGTNNDEIAAATPRVADEEAAYSFWSNMSFSVNPSPSLGLQSESEPESERKMVGMEPEASESRTPEGREQDTSQQQAESQLLVPSLSVDAELVALEQETTKTTKPDPEHFQRLAERGISPLADWLLAVAKQSEAELQVTQTEEITMSPASAIRGAEPKALETTKSNPDQKPAQAEATELSTSAPEKLQPSALKENATAENTPASDSGTATNSHSNWKLVPPGPGDPEEKIVDGLTWYWCTKCAKRKYEGRWSHTHGTSSHTGKVKPIASSNHATQEANSSPAPPAETKMKPSASGASEAESGNADHMKETEPEISSPSQTAPVPDQESQDMDVAEQQEPQQAQPSSPIVVMKPMPSPPPRHHIPSVLAQTITPQTLFSHFLSSPASAVGERPPLEPHFEEIPMLLLTEMQKDDSGDVAQALEALGQLLEKFRLGSENAAHQLGAHSIVLLAMRKFDSAEDVQTWGSCCLGFLATNHPDTTLAIIHLGGLEVIVNAINRFLTTISVQRYGCEALKIMFTCIQSQIEISRLQQQSNEEESARAVISEREGMAIYDRFVGEMHGLKILIRSMRKCHMVVRVLSPCCGMFSILAAFGHKAALREAGTVSSAAIALENNPKDNEMNRYATDFMVAMFSG